MIAPYEKKEEENYSNKVKSIIKILTIIDPEIIGSFTYKSREIWSDIDVQEYIISDKMRSEAIEEITKAIQSLIRRILDSKDILFSDFKAGIDMRYFIKYDRLNPVVKPKKQLLDEGLLTIDEEDADEDYIKSLYTIKWTPLEILAGRKSHRGATIYLKDALRNNSIVKIDIFVFYRDRFIEASNFLLIGNLEDGKLVMYNPRPDVRTELMMELDALDKAGKKFKALKRIFSILRLNYTETEDPKIIEEADMLVDFLNGPLGLLNNIKSYMHDLSTLIGNQLETGITPSQYKQLVSSLDLVKDRLANTPLSPSKMKEVDLIIDEIVHSDFLKLEDLKQQIEIIHSLL